MTKKILPTLITAPTSFQRSGRNAERLDDGTDMFCILIITVRIPEPCLWENAQVLLSGSKDQLGSNAVRIRVTYPTSLCIHRLISYAPTSSIVSV
jgi:hypothetical protein